MVLDGDKQEVQVEEKTIKDKRSIEYKFTKVENTTWVSKHERHGLTVELIEYPRSSTQTAYQVSYKNGRQRKSRVAGNYREFDNAVIAMEKTFNSQHKAQCRAVEAKERNKESNKEFLSSLKVGTILVSSWGYSMTIVDFYKVKAIKGSRVTLVELNSEYPRNDAGSISGSYVVAGDKECGEPKDYIVRGDRIRIDSSSSEAVS